MKSGSLSPPASSPKELPYCRRMCEWKSVFLAHLSIPGLLCSLRMVGGCAKMAGELKWNSQILPPTCRSLIKASFRFSLAICLLHVSTVVKLCVICCDSFIVLESTDAALLFLQMHWGEYFSVAFSLMYSFLIRLMTSFGFLEHICWKTVVSNKMWKWEFILWFNGINSSMREEWGLHKINIFFSDVMHLLPALQFKNSRLLVAVAYIGVFVNLNRNSHRQRVMKKKNQIISLVCFGIYYKTNLILIAIWMPKMLMYL